MIEFKIVWILAMIIHYNYFYRAEILYFVKKRSLDCTESVLKICAGRQAIYKRYNLFFNNR